MLEIRKSMGIVDSRVRWILKEFDDFANSIGLQEPHITEEFVKRWHKSRISDKEITIYGKSCIAPTDLIDVPQWMRMLYTDYTKATKIGVYTLYIHT